MATPLLVPPPRNAKQGEHLTWIKQFALDKYQVDLSDLQALFIPQYDGGGGGLYMKKTEKGFDTKVKFARDGLGPRQNEADSVEPGKVVFVKELPQGKVKIDDVVAVMWVMWHEVGHAVGDRLAQPNLSEPYAYRFEYRSLTEAFNTGKLTEWGIQKADLAKFYAIRKKHTTDSAERATFEALLA